MLQLVADLHVVLPAAPDLFSLLFDRLLDCGHAPRPVEQHALCGPQVQLLDLALEPCDGRLRDESRHFALALPVALVLTPARGGAVGIELRARVTELAVPDGEHQGTNPAMERLAQFVDGQFLDADENDGVGVVRDGPSAHGPA